VRRRLLDESGQAASELMGMIFWLLLVTFLVWQVFLATWTYTQASNAARTASRVEGRGGDGAKAARNALSNPLRCNLLPVQISGEKATVRIKIPIILPGLSSDGLVAKRDAELPG
jgi:uncharacterized membrane protein